MADTAVNGVGRPSMSKDATAPAPNGAPSAPSNYTTPAVENVLYSDIGINVLLSKLKQSIASARDFATFLKRRSALEEDHAQGLRKLARSTNEATSRMEARQGSYAQNLTSVTQLHERMADNGMQFAQSLHQMHEDLNDLATNMDRNRKHWKQEGLNNEKRVKDAELAMEKARQRYQNNAESYDRAKTGDSSGGRFGIKGPKSAEQREEDLLRKAQTSDSDYKSKVEAAQLARKENHDSHRPQAVKAMLDYVRESDTALLLQLQKFAAFSERLLVGDGMVVSPLQDLADGKIGSPSMREMIQGIDMEKDFQMYITSHSNQVPSRATDIKYEKHSALGGAASGPGPTSPTMASRPRGASQTASTASGPTSVQPAAPPPVPKNEPSSPTLSSSMSQPPAAGSMNSRQPATPTNSGPGLMGAAGLAGATGAAAMGSSSTPSSDSPSSSATGPQGFQAGRQPQGPPDRSFRGPPSGQQMSPPPTYSTLPSQSQNRAPPSEKSPAYRPSNAPPSGHPGNAWNDARHQPSPTHSGPYKHPPRGVSAAQNGPAPVSTTMSPTAGPSSSNYSGSAGTPATRLQPYNRVFGMKLDELFRRDDSAVPLVVYQCIQAVDLFGLDAEGIYRTSGNANHIAQLRAQFDHDSSKIDFRDPENFFHDVNSVAGLLKMFFRDLPDPLFTAEHYQEFIDAAKIEDPTTRRDSLHAIINALPDPNYATIRAITLHLSRVMEHGENNRMNVTSLAICFAPTMMGGAMGLGAGRDTGMQTRVVQTVLENTFMIFDED